jgi:hypothetical protein
LRSVCIEGCPHISNAARESINKQFTDARIRKLQLARAPVVEQTDQNKSLMLEETTATRTASPIVVPVSATSTSSDSDLLHNLVPSLLRACDSCASVSSSSTSSH